jgi:hypothetical protein
MGPKLPGLHCPACRAKIDDATAAFEGRQHPRPRDVTVCAYCSVVLIFDGDPLSVRVPTKAERVELAAIPEVAKVQRASVLARIKRGVPTRPRLN